MSENNENIYTLYDEDGTSCEFEHLDTVKLGDGEYCIFIPVNEDSDEYGVEILEVVDDENGEKALSAVTDEEIMDSVYEIFKERNADIFDFED